jgi:type II secretion system protein J
VQYLLLDNKFVRRHWRSLDQGIAEQPIQVVLLEDVESMEVEFQDGLGKSIEEWPLGAGSDDGEPIMLMFRLELPDMGEITRLPAAGGPQGCYLACVNKMVWHC